MKVEWQPVFNFENLYKVSKDGSVFGVKRNRILSIRTDRYGYIQYALSKNNHKHYRTAHSLVMEAFVGPRPDGKEVRHLNGNPKDNRLGNLEYSTHQINMIDTVKHKTHPSFKRKEEPFDYESE